MSSVLNADLLNSKNDIEKALLYYKNVVEINKNQKDAWIEVLLLELQLKK